MQFLLCEMGHKGKKIDIISFLDQMISNLNRISKNNTKFYV